MCIFCEYGSGSHGDLASRARVLQLLALVEHPEALSTEAALRLGREILLLLRPPTDLRRCDPVTSFVPVAPGSC